MSSEQRQEHAGQAAGPRLAVTEYGDGEPIVILHGLFGSGENWMSVARALGEHHRVIPMDLPNHGASPHTEEMSYQGMADAVIRTMDDLGLASAGMIGHSMGGKVAMHLALKRPERVTGLFVVDIAPREYPPLHREIIGAMNRVAEATPASRQEADTIMGQSIPNKAIRAFLLKNLAKSDEGHYAWRINLPVIEANYDRISGWPAPEGTYEGPVLFLGGSESDYVSPERDGAYIRSLFPRAEIETMEGAGHWIHAERREEFIERARTFFAT